MLKNRLLKFSSRKEVALKIALEYGSNSNVRNIDGKIPYDLATENGSFLKTDTYMKQAN